MHPKKIGCGGEKMHMDHGKRKARCGRRPAGGLLVSPSAFYTRRKEASKAQTSVPVQGPKMIIASPSASKIRSLILRKRIIQQKLAPMANSTWNRIPSPKPKLIHTGSSKRINRPRFSIKPLMVRSDSPRACCRAMLLQPRCSRRPESPAGAASWGKCLCKSLRRRS